LLAVTDNARASTAKTLRRKHTATLFALALGWRRKGAAAALLRDNGGAIGALAHAR
jgi:hypothetical protein